MAQLGATFDATAVDPSAPFEVIPAGKYPVQIVASDMRPTKDGSGSYLWLELEILDGEQKGRKVYDRLNLDNQNQQAVEIAQRALSAICHATGKLHVSDSEDLHYIPMVATVRVRPGRVVDGKEYSASNEVRGYEPANGAAPARPAAAPVARPAAVAAAPAAAPKAAPWKRNAAA